MKSAFKRFVQQSHITVRTEKYKWLAEAKIWSSNSYLNEGYLQLTERYSKGEKKNNHGGMFI
ncbi:hypothetical protein ABSDF3363 [Acinetobacter baumannii SDF]|uniref:Uncharacterized protein n=1 Tax=Acinetobacter baumannii (strain SDF) TaxID=509170 RepID=B0VN46_ACIBS|nr:hypothetical protein ABSDF3363 [Acinetobacter baumannii SDF]